MKNIELVVPDLKKYYYEKKDIEGKYTFNLQKSVNATVSTVNSGGYNFILGIYFSPSF